MSSLMPHLPADLIFAQLSRSPGNEVKSDLAAFWIIRVICPPCLACQWGG